MALPRNELSNHIYITADQENCILSGLFQWEDCLPTLVDAALVAYEFEEKGYTDISDIEKLEKENQELNDKNRGLEDAQEERDRLTDRMEELEKDVRELEKEVIRLKNEYEAEIIALELKVELAEALQGI